jgi:pSer/pThr/pTyr-binding forkhead associated (FHA) protein
VIPDSTVSGKHCEFYLVDEELYVRDMWSTNGTRILRGEKSIDIKGSNGQKLLEGDKLQLGKIKLVPTIK